MTTYLPGICNMLFSVDDISFDVKTYCKRLLIDITNILARDIFFFLWPISIDIDKWKILLYTFMNKSLLLRLTIVKIISYHLWNTMDFIKPYHVQKINLLSNFIFKQVFALCHAWIRGYRRIRSWWWVRPWFKDFENLSCASSTQTRLGRAIPSSCDVSNRKSDRSSRQYCPPFTFCNHHFCHHWSRILWWCFLLNLLWYSRLG